MNKVTIYVLANDPQLRPYAHVIKKEASEAVRIIAALIPLTEVDIVIMHSPGNIAFGVTSGTANGKHRVTIALNGKHKHFKKRLRVDLRKSLAHGLYHSVRMQKNGYYHTLVDDIIGEGLAIHFEIEVAGSKPPTCYVSLKNEAFAKIVARAKKEFYSVDFDYDDWFHGSKKRTIPRFTGYSIGYHLIKRLLKANPGLAPSHLVAKKSKKLVDEIALL
ncbi:MAG: hypothetical protein A3I29_03850 [Candidatus Magasanikbacteria bacterium RIFCSPLOWO2_02_FULL_44_11]|uniref:DUF2268 domain-containing protein n=2 Tax=Candidatus Magasanikiibacteriota TaxID=1752731 RepID=A0A1F6NBQ6_9BACT|nr:MAG: hypothetical protein A3D53_02695 [Candidatus Magasanikbacteria bacterium RIFCSPHIGHO2_02_FULL_45_10]OGH81376.1 MAG: hypothetical protein A3I29_03850 [Candidatus Magasanikbacteria bacterium RIFCSPLOWO2_02_FULL_44_11]